MKSVNETLGTARAPLPDSLPARMLNEFVYCPRLFYYEWVEGLFKDSADTVEGRHQHARVDEKTTPLPRPEELEDERLRSRSVTLSSDRYGVIAKMDLLEVSDAVVTPVDYKHGTPRETSEGIELWPADKTQLAVQGLILRDNGYRCDEGLVYYFKTKQRVRVVFDDALMAETVRLIGEARATATGGRIPPPLVDSPKCPGCSLVGICLPDETQAASSLAKDIVQLTLFADDPRSSPDRRRTAPVRRLIAPRDDLRAAYLNTQGTRVGKTGEVLQVREKETLKQEIRLGEISQLS